MLNTYYREDAPIAAYITNLGTYTEGYLIGEWVSFPLDEDDQAAVLESIGVSDEPDQNGNYYEEYFFTDYEIKIPGISWETFGEYASIDTLNEAAEAWDNLNDHERETVAAIMEAGYYSNVQDAIDNVDDYILNTDINDDYDLGYYWIEESGCYDIPEYLQNYIDYEAFGRDVRLESDGCMTSAGWLERC